MSDQNGGDGELQEFLEGLRSRPRTISSKYHYDERGSELFEAITRLDEYYPTRRERALLERSMPGLVREGLPRTLIELGAGNSEKSRIILDAMVEAGSGRTFVPVDVSEDFLADSARQLMTEYPSLEIEPLTRDITEPIRLPASLAEPRWFAFLGSTLGNFDNRDAIDLLRRIGSELSVDDRFLLGVDLRPGEGKSREQVERAYNDEEGVTAEFSLNLLNVVNERFGTDFDLDGWEHRSVYTPERGRIETDVVATESQSVTLPDGSRLEIEEGEPIRTEISAKYDRSSIGALFDVVGLEVERWIEDDEGYYALVLGRGRDPSHP